jgi:hypothetical protein
MYVGVVERFEPPRGAGDHPIVRLGDRRDVLVDANVEREDPAARGVEEHRIRLTRLHAHHVDAARRAQDRVGDGRVRDQHVAGVDGELDNGRLAPGQGERLGGLGGGTGGYVAAIRAAQLGIPTVLVEGESLGGTCLNVGCIPSKALIHVADEFHRARHFTGDSPLGIQVQSAAIDIARAVQWKDGVVKKLTGGVATLLKKAGARVVRGFARIVDGKTVEVRPADGGEPWRIAGGHLLLASGSVATALPGLPFGGNVISSTEALSPQTLPQRLVVVGAGYIGLELGIVYRKLGVEVAIVEAQPRILPAQHRVHITHPHVALPAYRPISAKGGRVAHALKKGMSLP